MARETSYLKICCGEIRDERPTRVADRRVDWNRTRTRPKCALPGNDEKRAGIYACAGCDLPVFTSEMKFDSGTGWPSFFTTIPGVFAQKKDFYLIYPRVEYHCIRCGGHHGHVFDDGPPPTNQRWCNNGVSLKFLPKDAKA